MLEPTIQAIEPAKICKTCGEVKDLECFGINRQNKDGLKHACKICTSAYQKQYYKDNLEKATAKARKYREAHPEYQKRWNKANPQKTAAADEKWRKAHPEQVCIKVQRYNAIKKSLISDFTIEQWGACLLYFDHKDAYTGLPMDNPSQDHVIPVSKGGNYTVSNIVPCEHSINCSKGNRDMVTWFRKQTYYDIEREKRILAYMNLQRENPIIASRH